MYHGAHGTHSAKQIRQALEMRSIVAGGRCFCLLQIWATRYPWDQTTGKEDSLKVEATGSMKNILPNENFHIMQNIILE